MRVHERRSLPRIAPVRGTTRVFAVLGDPVAHSLSPPMQNAAFAAARLDAVYVALRVRPADLAAAVAGLRAAGVDGLNVTVPHKEAMLRIVDEIHPRARVCGAVNTVVRTRRGFAGDNTDGDGFLAALAEAGARVRGIEALVIGAGGSARAIAHALTRAGAARLVIANRTAARAATLVTSLDPRRTNAAGLNVLRDRAAIGSFGLIVNCTSANLRAATLPTVAFTATRPDVLCCDLAYGRTPSPFLRGAAAAGRRTMDGTSLLLHQGALAFELWTKRRAPIAVMRRALAEAAR